MTTTATNLLTFGVTFAPTRPSLELFTGVLGNQYSALIHLPLNYICINLEISIIHIQRRIQNPDQHLTVFAKKTPS